MSGRSLRGGCKPGSSDPMRAGRKGVIRWNVRGVNHSDQHIHPSGLDGTFCRFSPKLKAN